jgi:hypothetical protein
MGSQNSQGGEQRALKIVIPTDEIDAVGLILDPVFLGKLCVKFIRKDSRETEE